MTNYAPFFASFASSAPLRENFKFIMSEFSVLTAVFSLR